MSEGIAAAEDDVTGAAAAALAAEEEADGAAEAGGLGLSFLRVRSSYVPTTQFRCISFRRCKENDCAVSMNATPKPSIAQVPANCSDNCKERQGVNKWQKIAEGRIYGLPAFCQRLMVRQSQ